MPMGVPVNKLRKRRVCERGKEKKGCFGTEKQRHYMPGKKTILDNKKTFPSTQRGGETVGEPLTCQRAKRRKGFFFHEKERRLIHTAGRAWDKQYSDDGKRWGKKNIGWKKEGPP